METVTEKEIQRINELYHKSKTSEGLTEEERTEQKALRDRYIQAIRASLRGTLDSVRVQNPDGSIRKLSGRVQEEEN